MERARSAGVALVRIAYCDNANLIRAKSSPWLDGLEAVLRDGIGFSVAQQALPIMGDVVLPASGITPAGETWLVPDPEMFTPLPYSAGAATMWETSSPRRMRRGSTARAGASGAPSPRRPPRARDPSRVRTGILPDARGGRRIGADRPHELRDDRRARPRPHIHPGTGVDTLAAMRLRVELVYPESGPGQFEVSIDHAAALGAADRHVLLRDAVRGVAYRHDAAASFAPKPLPNSAGSGCHLHLSVWRDGRNILYDPHDPLYLSREGSAWVAGLVHHLPGLCALIAPSVNSYARLRPHAWAGAFTCYGLDNREAVVRIVTPRRGPGSFNVELKTADGSANPYLALAGAIAAGLDGLRRELSPGTPIDGDPALLPEGDRVARGSCRCPRASARRSPRSKRTRCCSTRSARRSRGRTSPCAAASGRRCAASRLRRRSSSTSSSTDGQPIRRSAAARPARAFAVAPPAGYGARVPRMLHRELRPRDHRPARAVEPVLSAGAA